LRSAQRILAVASVPVFEGHGLASKARVGIRFGADVGPLLNLGPPLKADIAATATESAKGQSEKSGLAHRQVRFAFDTVAKVQSCISPNFW
jgi:hypothetical protein